MIKEGLPFISVRLWAVVNPTEDMKKVQQAFVNLCPPITSELKEDPEFGMVLIGTATGPASIAAFAKKFREQRILEAVRHQLLKSIQNGSILFGMQRQAAYMNRFHLCDLDDYSAMGPIRVEIRANKIQDVIDYISPPTAKGKPQFRNDVQLD
ncbi:MAG: RNA-binding domain-containing protein [Promethearchaeota archaeon]